MVSTPHRERMQIAIVGTGIAGMSAAWLLSQAHCVTVYEQAPRLGGHSHTLDVPYQIGSEPVDMGFIVYNPVTYPNLTALFAHFGVPTAASDMSFSVSLRDGSLEYGGGGLSALFAQPRNLCSPAFWRMLRDLARFWSIARDDAGNLLNESLPLAEYLRVRGLGEELVQNHLLPMAAAIWSTPTERIGAFPAAALLGFFENHGLLQLRNRPQWRTVQGGSREYVRRLTQRYAHRIRLGCAVRRVHRYADSVRIFDSDDAAEDYDHVVMAAHADQALALLADPSDAEVALLGKLRYGESLAVMHTDRALMPRRDRAWSSWNFISSTTADGKVTAGTTYWMNRLQTLQRSQPLFVTLEPCRAPALDRVLHRELYSHPRFDSAALKAQRELWPLQGQRRTWYCGAYFGAGFHEDGLQAGLAVAEALGGLRRPWQVPNESGRIHLHPSRQSCGLAA